MTDGLLKGSTKRTSITCETRGQVLRNMWKLQSVELDSHTKNFLDPYPVSLKCRLNGPAEIGVARETALTLDTEKLVVTFAAQIVRKIKILRRIIQQISLLCLRA